MFGGLQPTSLPRFAEIKPTCSIADRYSIVLGARFDRFTSVSFNRGILVGAASDGEIFHIAEDLKRLNPAHCVGVDDPYMVCTGVGTASTQAMDSRENAIGRIDTSGAVFSHFGAYPPSEYENWQDAREELIYEYRISGSVAGQDWSLSGLPTNECINNSIKSETVGGLCTGSAMQQERQPHRTYVTRMNLTAFTGFGAAESCEVGVSLNGYTGITTQDDFDVVAQFPPNSENAGAGEGYNYVINQLVEPGTSIIVSVGDGEFAPDGVSTPTCNGTLGLWVRIYGYPHNPFPM